MDKNGTRIRLATTVVLFIMGSILIFFSQAADALGLDRTPGFGMAQMFVFLVGLTSLTLGAFVYIRGLQQNRSRSLQASIGTRLAATGLIFAYAAGLADLLSIGTHPHPDFGRPFVGWLQLFGILLGIASILLGILLFYTSRRIRESSSMEFIANGNGEHLEKPAKATQE